ncbi:MAG: LacI family DNA-binding transcriptional regulator, partial [Catenulispora sp.]|nr:LacI family DNA-binding transcriptional regulator [Catenulispora sp.]
MTDDQPTAPAGGGKRQSGPVTIAYIAESAGVSVPTVSKVLNGRPGVSDHTRARVEELITQYGYRRPPNRSNSLELVFQELESMWAVEIIRGVEQAARRHRIGVTVSQLGLRDSVPAPLEDTLERRPKAVLCVAQMSDADREQLAANGIPFVVFDPVSELPEDVPFVGATHWR